jgi:hypothetical protein
MFAAITKHTASDNHNTKVNTDAEIFVTSVANVAKILSRWELLADHRLTGRYYLINFATLDCISSWIKYLQIGAWEVIFLLATDPSGSITITSHCRWRRFMK